MAMSVFLRSGARSAVLPNLVKYQSLAARLAGNYSPLQNVIKKESSLLQRVSELTAKTSARQMGLMSPPKHWTVERGLTILLYAFIPAAIALPGNAILDNLAVGGMLLHSHWGLESIIVDYVRPLLFGHTIPKLAHGLLIMITMFCMGSLFYFNQNDVGFGQAVRDLWFLTPSSRRHQEEHQEAS